MLPGWPNNATGDSNDAQLEALDEKVLITEGIIRKGDGWRCDICEQDNVSLSTHLGPRFKEGKRHLSYKDSWNLVQLLRGRWR